MFFSASVKPFTSNPCVALSSHPPIIYADDELSSVLSFLMQLGFRRVGQPCSWSELQSDRERSIAAHMMQLGLLRPFSPAAAKCEMGISKHHKKPKLEHEAQRLFFCPTRLASSLCAGFSHSAMSANADIAGGHIIVETNYRVYAFTSSKVSRARLCGPLISLAVPCFRPAGRISAGALFCPPPPPGRPSNCRF